MGDLIQFRPRARNTFDPQLARSNVRRVWPLDHDPATGVRYAMDDDNEPPETAADPFAADMAE